MYAAAKTLLCLLLLLTLLPSARSQTCTATFNYTLGPNGNVTFSSTSVPQASLMTVINWTLPGASPPAASGFTTAATYSANGIYTVWIQNSTPTLGCMTPATPYTISINNIVCGVVPGFSLSHGANGAVFFSNLSTGATSYTWNFGDASSSTTGSPTHTYVANGLYTVQLSASNGLCDSTVFSVINVQSYTCDAGFVYTVTPSGSATFSSTSAPQYSNNIYRWDFGNGMTYSAMGSPTAQVNYLAPGTFTVLQKLETPTNCFDTVTNLLSPCILQASFTNSQGTNGTVSFVNTTSHSAGQPVYHWDFGDSDTSSGISPVHQYASNGNYTVTLKAFHGLCDSDTSIAVLVDSYAPCVVKASFNHTVADAGRVYFKSTSTGVNPFHGFYWDFGDGFRGAGEKETHEYLNAGTHFVTLKISNTIQPSCADSVTYAVNVTGIACNASALFTVVPGNPSWNLVPQYPWNVTSAHWNWGDGSSSNTLYASHNYSTAGTFTICLTLTTSCAGTATYCAPATFTAPAGSVQVIRPVLATIHDLSTEPTFAIYPNPATSWLHIVTSGEGDCTLRIFDAKGQVVMESGFSGNRWGTDLTSMSDGIYLVQCQRGNSLLYRRLVICRQ